MRPRSKAKTAASSEPAGSRYAGQRLTVVLSPEVIERIRTAVYWTPGETLTSLVERSAIAEVARLEKRRGEPFPRLGGPVKRGRPIGR
jgi:hypothetical protein